MRLPCIEERFPFEKIFFFFFFFPFEFDCVLEGVSFLACFDVRSFLSTMWLLDVVADRL